MKRTKYHIRNLIMQNKYAVLFILNKFDDVQNRYLLTTQFSEILIEKQTRCKVA